MKVRICKHLDCPVREGEDWCLGIWQGFTLTPALTLNPFAANCLTTSFPEPPDAPATNTYAADSSRGIEVLEVLVILSSRSISSYLFI